MADFYSQLTKKWFDSEKKSAESTSGGYVDYGAGPIWISNVEDKSKLVKPTRECYGDAPDYTPKAISPTPEMNMNNDPTNPNHYQGSIPKELEHHRVVAAHGLDYHIGCATKYLFRAGKKQSAHLSDLEKEIQDLEKARTYIKMKIDLLKEKKDL